MERTRNTCPEKWERRVTFSSEVFLCKIPFAGPCDRKQRNVKRILNKSSVKRGIWLSRLRTDGCGCGLLQAFDCIKVCDFLYHVWDTRIGVDEE